MIRDEWLAQRRQMTAEERREEAVLWAKDGGGGLLLIAAFALILKYLPVLVVTGWALFEALTN